MPARPPVFRRPGVAERKPWERPLLHQDKRQRGRPGQRARAQVLAEEPLCRLCLAAGRTSETKFVDHVIPLAWGGPDERWNKQGLCGPCHDAKSLSERQSGPPADVAGRLRELKRAWLAGTAIPRLD